MESIRDDLLTEILIRLPDSRQAVRCAAVCKGWYSLVTGDQFARSFVAHHRGLDDADFSAAVLLLLLEYSRRPTYSIPAVSYENYMNGETQAIRFKNYLSFLPGENVEIRAYCDDLLLVTSGELSLCVCNPVTKKYRCGIPVHPGFHCGYRLLFTRRRRGHNRVDHSYHVILLFGYDERVGKMSRTDFSFETGQWTSPTMVRLPSDCHITLAELFLNEAVTCGDGLVYWLGGEPTRLKRVIAFDPLAAASPNGHRDFLDIPLPAKTGEIPFIWTMRLGNYRGRLRAVHIQNALWLRVWDLNRATSCWSLVHDAALGISVPLYVFPLALYPGDRNVVLLEISTGDILKYDLSSRTGQTLGQHQKNSCVSFVYPLCSIWPTTVPLLDTAVARVTSEKRQCSGNNKNIETLKQNR